ncbi:MAG: DUF222 domain-containing protein [Nocardioidaceae bacterium]
MFSSQALGGAAEDAWSSAILSGPWSERPSSALTEAQLVDRVTALERLLRAVSAAQLSDVAALATRREAADAAARVGPRLEGRTVGTQVGLALGISPSAGGTRAAFARCMIEDHPALFDLARSGRVSDWALRMVATATNVLAPEQQRVVAQQLADDIGAHAADGNKELTPFELAQAALARVIAIDPEAALRRCERARKDPQVSITDKRDGVATLWARGPAEEAVALFDTLDGDARGRRADGDERPISELMWAALYESVVGLPDEADVAAVHPTDGKDLLSSSDLGLDDVAFDDFAAQTPTAAAPTPPRTRRRLPARRVEVQIVIGAGTLLGYDDAPALLRGYGAIPAELARAITSDAGSSISKGTSLMLRRLFCDPVDGRLLTMETNGRLYAGGLRDFCVWRDQACRLSGGPIRQLDHIDDHTNGGPTSGTNGEGLAVNPHVIKDHPEVSVATRPYEPDGQTGTELLGLRANAPNIVWTMPTGHSYVSAPPPALGHGSRPSDVAPPTPPPERLLEGQELRSHLQRRHEELCRSRTRRRRRARYRARRIFQTIDARERRQRHALIRRWYQQGHYACEKSSSTNGVSVQIWRSPPPVEIAVEALHSAR